MAGSHEDRATHWCIDVIRSLYFSLGLLAVALGTVGIFVPLLPTVPFYILAAFCFGRSHPALERWLLDHPKFGESIRMWRAKGAISPRGKKAAIAAFVISAVSGYALTPWPWALIPPVIAVIGSLWIWSRPDP